MHSLDEIQAALISYTSLQSERVDADPQQPVSQLLIRLAPEQPHGSDGQEYILRLFCANEVLEAGSEEVSSVFYFVIRYPEDIVPSLLSELQRLLGVLNHLLPLGTLELHPEEGLFFRHMLLTEDRSLDGLLALDIIQGIEALLPRVFDWIRQVLAQAAPGEVHEQLRSQFRQLLQQTPMLETLVLPPPAESQPRPQALSRSVLYAGGLTLGSLIALIVLLLAGPLWAAGSAGVCLAATVALTRLYQQRHSRWLALREQQRQLRFYWQLLEVESIKLAYQDHALDQQQQQVESKLAELAAHPVDYPADILRLRGQMRSLRQLQSRLDQRSQQLRLKRQELEQSRFQLLRERLSLMPEAEPVTAELSGLDAGFSSEDVLMQNLLVTLEYLDFQVRSFAQGGSPVVEVIPRPRAPAISIRWLQRWHLAARQPEHTWMLCFDMTLPVHIPEPAWPRVQELLRVFNRFLPLGTLICDYARNQLTLRYRFVRLRGDLSTLLVMEILEVMACFGERLQQRLLECVTQQKQLETILQETEQDFQALQL
ncbi:MAG: hypothetical protein ACAI44_22615 [Candidatus Sericytochromatia bacterium]